MSILCGLPKQARMFSCGLRRFIAAGNGRAARQSKGGSGRTGLEGNEEGAALVEIALTVPALLAILTGIVSFGIAFSNQLTLTQAVGSAGQYLSQIRTSTTDPCAATYSALTNAAPGLNPANITMTVTLNGNVQSGNSCSGQQAVMVQGTPVTVYATYPCKLSIYGVTFANACMLSAKVTEYGY
jgi:Flp pilus assembly protein TadG